ncbi:MAG: tetratricopeptide repeat protein [Calditrichaeota bacterium]|nr:MAG: tetratricopeptide repeat protein [Calditrichota bacterium]
MSSKSKLIEDIPSRIRTKVLYTRFRPQYEMAQAKISRKIRKSLAEHQINATLRIRLKTFDSFFQKLLRFYHQGRSDSLIIHDLIGIRIVCPFLGDIETIKQMLIDNFKVIEIEQKGESKGTGEFGYDSIHMLIELPNDFIANRIPYTDDSCEIQIRTKLQDAWAEVEHELIYKADYSVLNEYIKRKLAMLNASLTLSDMIFQEIRDYQQTRQSKEKRRRNSILTKIEALNEFSSIEEYKTAAAPPAEPTPTNLPNNPIDRLLVQALDAHSRQDYPAALKLYTQILEKSNDNKINSIIYNHRGMVYFVLSNLEEAIQDFSRSLSLNHNNFRAYNNRGLVYRMLKKYDRALEDFESSLEVEPLQPETYFNRSQVYFEINDLTNALQDCNKALNIHPDYQPAQKFLQIIQSKLFE